MHDHSVKEDTIKEILAAFQAQDKDKKGYISTQEARNILTHLGEGLSRHEGLFDTRSGNILCFSFRFFKKGSCQLLAKVCARSTG